ncbi:MAG: diphthamide synthesis protein [Candidatus Nanoarchaeia archaeon]
MEPIFIEARKHIKLDYAKLDKLIQKGKTISLASTIQYLSYLQDVQKYLQDKGMKVILKQGAAYKGHILGCQSQAFDKQADILLLLADGKFHAMNNALQLDREIYVFTGKTLEKLSQQDIDKLKKKRQTAINKFLSADNIGLLVSIKPGQNQTKKAEQIKKQLQKQGKQAYIFITDNINLEELENFPQIQAWVNTACPGLATGNTKIANLQDIQQYLDSKTG